jgi:hypothetical protein
LFAALVLVGLLGGPAAAFEISHEFPTVGTETTITLSAPVDTITLTHQPAAPVASTTVLPTDGKTTVTWVPDRAGIWSIEAGGEKKDVSVKFDGTPPLGIAIFLGAGVILIGGAVTCLRALFAHPD